jgi:hypothetical protein
MLSIVGSAPTMSPTLTRAVRDEPTNSRPKIGLTSARIVCRTYNMARFFLLRYVIQQTLSEAGAILFFGVSRT